MNPSLSSSRQMRLGHASYELSPWQASPSDPFDEDQGVSKTILSFPRPRSHCLVQNSQDIDLDGPPPDDLSDFILRLRERAPAEEDPLSIFIKACRQQSDGIDSSASSAFHQHLVAVDRLEDAAKFLSLHGVKQTFAVYPNGPRVSSETYLPHRVYVWEGRQFAVAVLSPG